MFIVLGQDGPLLVYVIEAGDIEHASDAYKNSPLAIDKEHRAVLEECLLERLRVDPLFECAVQAFRKDAA